MSRTSASWPEMLPSDDPLDRLVKISRAYGGDPAIVLAGGGNTSVKVGERLLVKASGAELATIGRDGFVAMDRAMLRAILDADAGSDPGAREARFKERIHAARLEPEKGQRPSVECLLHELMPAAYVVHSHPTAVNALTCCARGAALAREWFGDAALWLPYVDPGFVLASTLRAALKGYRERTSRVLPDAILMANHGLVVAGDEPDEVRERTERVLERVGRHLGDDWRTDAFGGRAPSRDDAERARHRLQAAARIALSPGAEPLAVASHASDLVLDFVGSDSGREAARAGPLTPDQIVYCNSFPLWLDDPLAARDDELARDLRAAADAHARVTRFPPKVILAPGVGLVAAGESAHAAATARALYVDAIQIMAGARRLGGIRHMSEAERRFIEDWEVEAYRREVARRRARQGGA